ncbi:50S ribosomal protein L33 [Candidatus Vidania fulgoroideae]|nr:50S ribosomal protein L33 [Candidatus Vidania fulgoroideae]WDR79295.1 50S ribosomal protein L33 [Candidatus Vidania fulgoroideae]
MKKNKKQYLKYISNSGSGHFYIFKKRKNYVLSIRKYDPIFKKHYIYKYEK